MLDLIIATKNKNKVKEIKSLLRGLAINVLSLEDGSWKIPEIEEDGKTFQENAAKKAVVVARIVGKLCLADDSGLEVDSLGGKPGIYSARFAGSEATDRENNIKLLKLMQKVPLALRSAQFNCCIAIANPAGKVDTVSAICRGAIVFSERGTAGFGYDPLFVPNNYDKTFAQLGLDIKNKLSHRARALEKAKLVLEKISFLEEGDKKNEAA